MNRFFTPETDRLCDVIIDKAALEAIYAAGKEAKADIIRDYAESTVGVADIKIAVRSQKTAKSIDFGSGQWLNVTVSM